MTKETSTMGSQRQESDFRLVFVLLFWMAVLIWINNSQSRRINALESWNLEELTDRVTQLEKGQAIDD